jgi:hypothetical protein
MMASSKWACALLLSSIAWTARSADDLESLDEDFLSYLAEFEGDEDDWTIVEPVSPATPAAAKPGPEPKPVTKAPTKTTPTSETPKPATPDDGSKR